MNVQEFRDTLAHENPPEGAGPALAGLWWDAKGDWTRAHESAQDDKGSRGAWVHAYLNRKEGDVSNAEYWYLRAGKQAPTTSFETEWNDILRALLVDGSDRLAHRAAKEARM